MINLFFVYQFVKLLTTPFEEWELFKLGIIDEKGNTLKKRRDLRTAEEKDAVTPFVNLVKNIKKTLSKFAGKSKLASYAAALYLIKEHKMFTDELVEDYDNVDMERLYNFVETEITNNTTTALDGKPVVSKRTKYKKKNKKENCNETDT